MGITGRRIVTCCKWAKFAEDCLASPSLWISSVIKCAAEQFTQFYGRLNPNDSVFLNCYKNHTLSLNVMLRTPVGEMDQQFKIIPSKEQESFLFMEQAQKAFSAEENGHQYLLPLVQENFLNYPSCTSGIRQQTTRTQKHFYQNSDE